MISIRNAKNAKQGLIDMIEYIGQFINVSESRIVEIGAYVGDATNIFAQHFKEVFVIDPWKNGYDDKDAASYQHDMKIIEKQFDDNIMAVYKNVTKIKGKSVEVSNDFNNVFFDVIYIDGEHTYSAVSRDIYSWKDKIKPGGFLAGHDYQGRFPGTIQAVDEFKKPDKTFNDTSWCVRM